jgi:hypothetical protein
VCLGLSRQRKHFLWGNFSESVHLENRERNVRTILKYVLERLVMWMELDKERVQWWVFVLAGLDLDRLLLQFWRLSRRPTYRNVTWQDAATMIKTILTEVNNASYFPLLSYVLI